MNELDRTIFFSLFKEACLKGFGFPLTSSLTETDSKLLSNKIFESTGLVIGAKSIKNYSFYVIKNKEDERKESPSVATLDTFARYVLDAPYTDELKRKESESHYPYWFEYRSRFSDKFPERERFMPNRKISAIILLLAVVLVAVFYPAKYFSIKNKSEAFTDNFNSVTSDSLEKKGWKLESEDTSWWNKRDEKPGHLALYTLKGDNWPDSVNHARIRNRLIRRINSDCFIVEIHMSDFIPGENWQQAGIILSEDSSLTGKMLRLSISYNDFFGGFSKPPEIIIQAISSAESGLQSKPEEIGHLTLFNIGPDKQDLVRRNLAKTALKIEKKGKHFRFLYFVGPKDGFAFREAVGGDFDIKPEYVSIFSIQGWAVKENPMPVYFDLFKSAGIPCGK